MTVLKREEFFIISVQRDGFWAEKVPGYTFEVEAGPGLMWALGTYKKGRRWMLTDILTGMLVRQYPTRRECVEAAESDELKGKLLEYYIGNTEDYLAKSDVFAKLVGGRVMSQGEYSVAVAEMAAMRREANEAGAVAEAAAEASVSTLERWREVMSGWDNVAVTQENERRLIWVRGDTRPHTDELKAMGFQWGSEKCGWWIAPTGWKR